MAKTDLFFNKGLNQLAKIINYRSNVWASFFKSNGIDVNHYTVVVNSTHEKDLPLPEDGIEIYFSPYAPIDEFFLIPRNEKHPLKGDIVPF